jgi:hypothetical protein
MFNLRDLLLQILTIIEYSDSKEEFVNKFITNVHLQALLDLISTLPVDRQEELKLSLARSSNHQDKVTRTLSIYFFQEQIQDAFEAASRDSIEKYLEAIDDTLSNDQRQELVKLL